MIDVAVINIAHQELSRYKLLVIPGLYLLDKASPTHFVVLSRTGPAVMTADSAKVTEHNQWYDTPLPDRLHDVFGLRTNEVYTGSPVTTKIRRHSRAQTMVR